MAKLNQTVLLGTLVADPNTRYSNDGKAITEIRLAADGFKENDTVFVDVTIFGKTAENVGKFKKKGEQVVVVGRLAFDQWEDKTTKQKRSKHYIVANEVTFLGGKSTGENEPVGTAKTKSSAPQTEQQDDSDVPF